MKASELVQSCLDDAYMLMIAWIVKFEGGIQNSITVYSFNEV